MPTRNAQEIGFLLRTSRGFGRNVNNSHESPNAARLDSHFVGSVDLPDPGRPRLKQTQAHPRMALVVPGGDRNRNQPGTTLSGNYFCPRISFEKFESAYHILHGAANGKGPGARPSAKRANLDPV